MHPVNHFWNLCTTLSIILNPDKLMLAKIELKMLVLTKSNISNKLQSLACLYCKFRSQGHENH